MRPDPGLMRPGVYAGVLCRSLVRSLVWWPQKMSGPGTQNPGAKRNNAPEVLVKSYARSYAVLCGVRITLLHFGECFGSPEIFTTKTGLVYVVMRSLMTTKAS